MANPDQMRLWTIRTKEAWECAEKLGVLEFNEIADKEICDWFRPAYNWMAGQLKQRLKEYPCNKYPIWAWYHPKPDLRRSGYLPRGTMGVRVEFLVESDRVLLSVKPGMLYLIAGICLCQRMRVIIGTNALKRRE